MKRAGEMRTLIERYVPDTQGLSFVEANLTDPHIWDQIIREVDFVQHIASPFPRVLPKTESELLEPAKEGTLRVLRAAAANGVKRVVLTSSTGSIAYGKSRDKRTGTFDESAWTDPNNLEDTSPYFRSKTVAEKAAWDFIKQDTSGLELTTICPGAIMGPVLEKDFGTSANIVLKLLDGSSPAVPKLGFGMVDVRSVADLHVRAMEMTKAANQRYACTAGYLSFLEVADILREAYPNRNIPRWVLPNFAVRVYAHIDPSLKPVLMGLGYRREVYSHKAMEQLNWNPISPKEAVLACANSLIELGLA